MPYIKKERRELLTDYDYRPANAGELNFCITDLIDMYLGNSEKKYHDYNEIIGVLECAKQEFYRRMVVPYEDIKLKENGDCYTNA